MQQKIIKSIFLFLSLFLISKVCVAQEINTDVLYKLVSPSGLVIDNKESTENDARLYLAKDIKNNKGQLWKLTPLSNGYYLITNPYGEMSVDNGNVSSGNGKLLLQWGESRGNLLLQAQVLIR